MKVATEEHCCDGANRGVKTRGGHIKLASTASRVVSHSFDRDTRITPCFWETKRKVLLKQKLQPSGVTCAKGCFRANVHDVWPWWQRGEQDQ